jgi:ATP-dependent Lon protease
MQATGLRNHDLQFTDSGIQSVIRNYTREAGVRNLEREISAVCRKVTRSVVRSGGHGAVTLDAENVANYIGIARFRSSRQNEKNEIGVVTGLAWTEVGGEILLTEAMLMPGKGDLKLTGKLGDVMQESAQAALSYVRARANLFGIPKDFHKRLDLHIHVPEGAIPKDGPSAGITMATSLISALTRIPVRSDVAMTGEITLRGKVLPIGGLKEKLLAAHRAGITTLILPKENQKDLADVPEEIQAEFTLHFVETMDEVLKVALTQALVPLDEKIGDDDLFRPQTADGPVQQLPS